MDVAGRTYAVATKPGVPAHGATDTASMLLAEHVRVSKDDTVVYMNCGNGLAPAVELEASGGITRATIRSVAETGVERISCGSLTYAAPALDIALDWL